MLPVDDGDERTDHIPSSHLGLGRALGHLLRRNFLHKLKGVKMSVSVERLQALIDSDCCVVPTSAAVTREGFGLETK